MRFLTVSFIKIEKETQCKHFRIQRKRGFCTPEVLSHNYWNMKGKKPQNKQSAVSWRGFSICFSKVSTSFAVIKSIIILIRSWFGGKKRLPVVEVACIVRLLIRTWKNTCVIPTFLGGIPHLMHSRINPTQDYLWFLSEPGLLQIVYSCGSAQSNAFITSVYLASSVLY